MSPESPVGATDRSSHKPIIYVAGYGRSGSTLLDMLLDTHLDRAIGSGELANLFEEVDAEGVCGCGLTVRECPVWSRVLASFEALGVSALEANRLTRRSERIFGAGDRLYFEIWGTVLSALRSSATADLIVDSSKVSRLTFNRIRRLQALGNSVVVLHLVRDVDGVMASLRKGRNRALEVGSSNGGSLNVIRGSIGWLVAHLGTEYLVRRLRLPRRLVHYESLVNEPAYRQELIEWVAQQSAVTVSRQFDDALDAGHGLSGNRMRRSADVSIRPAARPASISKFDSVAASVLRAVGRRLGYYR